MNSNLGVTDSKSDRRKLVSRCVAGECVALLAAVVLGTWDGVIDGLDSSVVNKGQRGTGVSDSGVARAVDSLAVHGGRSRLEVPEALAVIHIGIDNLVTGGADNILVNIAECVERIVALG